MKKENDDWRWPRVGMSADDSRALLAAIDTKMVSLYKGKKLPMCFPGTCLPYMREPMVRNAIGRLLAKQINLIGCHTHGEPGEDGFKWAQEREKEVIGWVASILGGTLKTVDGYFCGGGTEANEEGLWIARQWLRKTRPIFSEELVRGIKQGIVVFTTQLLHYSLSKAVELLDIGEHVSDPDVGEREDSSGGGVCFVAMDETVAGECSGQMSMADLKAAFERKYLSGYRRFVFAPAVGTSLMGSIDPVSAIARFIADREQDTDAAFYLHVDASFAAYTVPFMAPEFKFGFDVLPDQPNRLRGMSMAVDADKMGRLPYPAGIFLCRKGLMDYVNQRVDYVDGHRDDTISGSRSCLAPIVAWYLYQRRGMRGHREYVARCLECRDYLIQLVTEQLPWVKVLPYSPWVNFAPMEIPIDPESGRIPDRELKSELLRDYQLRSGKLLARLDEPNGSSRAIYKICVMPHHTKRHLERFVKDLERARKAYQDKV